MKRFLSLSIILSLILTDYCYAGSWEQDAFGWKYKTDAGNYVTANWEWIDTNNDGQQECFYFNELGYMLVSGFAPDGSEVNANGEWVVNGVVQHKASNVIISNSDQMHEYQSSVLGINDSIKSYKDLNVSGNTSQEATHNILSQFKIRCQTVANNLYNENLKDIKVTDWSQSDKYEVLTDYDSYLSGFYDDYEIQVDYVMATFNLPKGRRDKMISDAVSVAMEIRANLSEKLSKAINKYKGKDK